MRREVRVLKGGGRSVSWLVSSGRGKEVTELEVVVLVVVLGGIGSRGGDVCVGRDVDSGNDSSRG